MRLRNYAKETPDIILYRQNRKTSLGYVRNIHNFTADYNFGTASEISFEIPKKIYDNRTNSWINNPNYDNLKPDMLLYLNDPTEYYKFTGGCLKPDEEYSVSSYDNNRRGDTLNYNINGSVRNFTVKSETELYDIGTKTGYNWVWGGCIKNDGTFADYSEYLSQNVEGYPAYNLLACKEFIPIHTGDIISFQSYYDDTLYYCYNIHYYKDADACTYLGSYTSKTYLPCAKGFPSRIYVTLPQYNNIPVDEGYFRIEIYVANATYKDKMYKTYLPSAGYLKVYSRERLCTSFSVDTKVNWGIKECWWIITNVEDTNETGYNSTLKVTAQSYEMTLSKKTFSLSSGTLPLFVPDKINNLVTSNSWRTDYYADSNKHPQKFTRGLLNQILDYLPQWKIGCISPSVCTKYRSFDDMDNVNIYSFLTNEVASAYHCYFIFDAETMTINIVNGEVQYNQWKYHLDNAQVGYHSKTILTWDNAIKNTNIHSTDDRCVTALRIHTSNDQYGLGLVNPTGNNIIYNFASVSAQLDFIADTNKNRTLQTALNSWSTEYTNNVSTYQSYAKTLVDINLKKIKLESKLQKALTEYLTIGDEINTRLIDKYSPKAGTEGYDRKIETTSYTLKQILVSDIPRTPTAMSETGDPAFTPWKGLNYANYYSDTLYTKLYSAAESYWGVRNEIDANNRKYANVYKQMSNISQKLTFNYATAKKLEKNNKATALSPTEILELQNYITEGDWTNENIVFSDKYSAEDIITTLKDVMTQAKSDHDNYLSKQCYEFEIESANILAIPEMKDNIADLTLGTAVSLEVKDGDWQYPVLLSIHINYDDVSDFSLTFNTNYSAKPLKKRFIDCFNTISQTSVKNTTFNFTE